MDQNKNAQDEPNQGQQRQGSNQGQQDQDSQQGSKDMNRDQPDRSQDQTRGTGSQGEKNSSGISNRGMSESEEQADLPSRGYDSRIEQDFGESDESER